MLLVVPSSSGNLPVRQDEVVIIIPRATRRGQGTKHRKDNAGADCVQGRRCHKAVGVLSSCGMLRARLPRSPPAAAAAQPPLLHPRTAAPSRLRTRRSSTRSPPHSTQSESPKAGVGMNQIVGCYLALNSGFGGCQIVLIHVLGGCQIVEIRLQLGVSAFELLLTPVNVVI